MIHTKQKWRIGDCVEYVMAFMFVVYEAVALYGVLNLSHKTATST